jgi:N utilization substance protein B
LWIICSSLSLKSNKQLNDFNANAKNNNWSNEEEFLKGLFEQIAASNTYQLYMINDKPTYESDREFWRKIYKDFIYKNETLDRYCSKSRASIGTMIKRLSTPSSRRPSNVSTRRTAANQPLLPEYKDEEDRDFARPSFQMHLS